MIRVDYAGAGGSCLGIESLGLRTIGVEIDKWSCATRSLNGMSTVRSDLSEAKMNNSQFNGYWASPPCQTFSNAGGGSGLKAKDRLVSAIQRQEWTAARALDDRTRHVVIAAQIAISGGFDWIVLEQVPSVLRAWNAIGENLVDAGYSVWTGVLNAADYGVPQNRRRAFLLASSTRHVGPPTPTHASPQSSSTLPWHVSWGEALRIGADGPDLAISNGFIDVQKERTSNPVVAQPLPLRDDSGSLWWIDRRQRAKGKWARMIPSCEPSPTVTAVAISKSQWVIRDGANPLTGDRRYKLGVNGAKILQGFPDSHTFAGPASAQLQQIGNAVPPILAARCVEAVR